MRVDSRPLLCKQGAHMEIKPEPDQDLQIPALPSAPDHIIDSYFELLSSGRPLSEVLAETKRLTPAACRQLDSGLAFTLNAVAGTSRASLTHVKRVGVAMAGILLVLAATVAALGSTEPARSTEHPFATAPVPPPITVPIPIPEQPPQAEASHQGQLAPPVSRVPGPEVAVLLTRGDIYMANADVRTARILYKRALMAGDTEAAVRLGATCDPVFIQQARLPVQPDAVLASYSYAWAGVPVQE
jgi:hypothetical protein